MTSSQEHSDKGTAPTALGVSSHTPGPWEYIKPEYLSHDAAGVSVLVSEGGIFGGPADDPCWVIEGEIDHEANARLIAAAPDMYAALVALTDAIKASAAYKSGDLYMADVLPAAEAALSQATAKQER